MTWYYRLSSLGSRLPTSWAYSDETPTPGFQVWIYPEQVLSALLGVDWDGTYTPEEGYTDLILVRANQVYDSVGAWYTVRPEDVLETRIVSTLVLYDQLIAQLDQGEEWELDEAEQFLAERASELEAWLLAESTPVKVSYVDTLHQSKATLKFQGHTYAASTTAADLQDAVEVFRDYTFYGDEKFLQQFPTRISVRTAIKQVKKQARENQPVTIPIKDIETHHDWGRRIAPSRVNNPIIVVKAPKRRYSKKKYVVLDGQHRLYTLQDVGQKTIQAIVIDLEATL